MSKLNWAMKIAKEHETFKKERDKDKMIATGRTIPNGWVITDECTKIDWSIPLSFAPSQAATPCNIAECNTGCYNIPTPKGNNPMYVDNDKHIESAKINYLSDRAATARYAAQDKITEAFNLSYPAAPKTPEELVAAITAGNYTITPKTERNRYHNAMENIVWRAPTVVADPDGAAAAKKVFETLYKSTQDAIMIGTPADALTAVQALDAWTPTVAAPATATTAS